MSNFSFHHQPGAPGPLDFLLDQPSSSHPESSCNNDNASGANHSRREDYLRTTSVEVSALNFGSGGTTTAAAAAAATSTSRRSPVVRKRTFPFHPPSQDATTTTTSTDDPSNKKHRNRTELVVDGSDDEDREGLLGDAAAGRPPKQPQQAPPPPPPPEDAPWEEAVHRAFVEAVFMSGIRHASPSVILEKMHNRDGLPLTSERIKSRLQKYRNSAEKSKAEFLKEYDSWMSKALAVGGAEAASCVLAAPETVLDMMGIDQSTSSEQPTVRLLLGGDAAAFLTYSCMAEDSKARHEASATASMDTDFFGGPLQVPPFYMPNQITPDLLRNGSIEYAKMFTGSPISFPRLTAEERNSPLGISLTHVIGLFYSMTNHLIKERASHKNAVAARELSALDPPTGLPTDRLPDGNPLAMPALRADLTATVEEEISSFGRLLQHIHYGDEPS